MTAVGTLPQWLGQLAFAFGLFLSVAVIVFLSLRDRAAVKRSSDALDEDGSPSEPQIIGSACASCGDAIRTLVDGGLCRTCERPVHRACLKHHKRDAHAAPPRGTYR